MPTILYEDPHLLLIEKPVDVISQDSDGDCIPYRLTQRGYTVKTVHRLDRSTGGVMAYARTGKASAALSMVVGQHALFQKTYFAVIQGIPIEQTGTFTDLLYHDVRKNKSYVVHRLRKGVREATLDYTVLETVTSDAGSLSLVLVRLHTGRTHQIRVQFAARKMPLYGDTRYGGIKGEQLGLWSHQLTLPHPVSGEDVSAVSFPDWTKQPWRYFKPL